MTEADFLNHIEKEVKSEIQRVSEQITLQKKKDVGSLWNIIARKSSKNVTSENNLS